MRLARALPLLACWLPYSSGFQISSVQIQMRLKNHPSGVSSMRRSLTAFDSTERPNETIRPHTERKLEQNFLPSTALACLLGMLVFFASGWSTPMVALAADDMDVSVLNHEYSDPLHPQCRRTIQVDKDGKTFHYSGTGVKSNDDDSILRGCSPEEIKKYGLRTGSFDGQILQPELRLSVGDGIHEGQWEPANSVTTPGLQYKNVDGIRWNDGNKWIVKDDGPKPLPKVIGE